MKKITRILIIAASIALIICFFTPLWVITLDAPQYPEGLGLYIWVDKITGDLQTINGLNHYIGMKTIEPDSIKELTIMPYVLGFLITFGVVTGILGKKKILVAWTLLFIVLGIAGGIDFYIWEYDYGHNLSEDAAIKVPGMTYQPPLIGSKELLNFTASSYPDTGGQVLIASGFIALLLTIFELKRKQRSGKNEKDISNSSFTHGAPVDKFVQN